MHAYILNKLSDICNDYRPGYNHCYMRLSLSCENGFRLVMGICLKPERVIKYTGLTAIAFGIFAFLNLLIELRRSVNDEWPLVNGVPRNHLEFADWEANQQGPGEQGHGVILEGKERELGEQSMKTWFMNVYARSVQIKKRC